MTEVSDNLEEQALSGVSLSRLRFPSGLEQEYQLSRETYFRLQMRITLVAAAVLTGCFLLFDFFSARIGLRPFPLAMILGILLPTIVTVVGVSYYAGLRGRMQLPVTFLVIVYNAGLLAILVESASTGYRFPVAPLFLMLVASHFMLGLGFRSAMVSSLLLFLAYGISGFAGQLQSDWQYTLFFLACAIVLLGWGSYQLEYHGRRIFLQTRLLRKQAGRDGLTGLYNRRSFEERYIMVWKQAERAGVNVAIAMMDVDQFKYYNDHYGHLAGDECLRKISRRLRAYVKRPLDFIARYGGEELVAVYYDISPSALPAKLDELRQSIEALRIPHETSTVGNHVTISIGAAIYNPRPMGMPAQELLNQADKVLYKSKEKGRNRSESVNLIAPLEGECAIKIVSDERVRPA